MVPEIVKSRYGNVPTRRSRRALTESQTPTAPWDLPRLAAPFAPNTEANASHVPVFYVRNYALESST
jgi:hypothetical protein